jgi:DNA-binding transcriptional MerR regulator
VGRTEAGYRLYDDASLQRLRFIARAKQLGCSLDEVADLSEAWDGGRCAHVQERLRATVEAKVAEAQRRIAELTVLTADLQRAAAGLTESPTGACDDTCGCVSEPAPAAATMQAVPLLARATATAATAATAALTTAAGPAADACGDEGCGCGTDAAGDEPPVACTLDVGRMGSRVEEWAALLDAKEDMLAGVVRRTAIDGGVRLRFGPGTDVAEVARLAAAEQDCCRFFRFTLSIDTDGIALEVRAPADAFDVVTALFGAAA